MCTSFTIGDTKSGVIYGRTMEFTLQLHSAITAIAKGTELTGTDRNGVVGTGGMSWTATHGAVGMNALGVDIVSIDGMNDAGLVVGTLNFPVSAKYMDVADGDQSKSIGSFEYAMYILTTCATVQEVREVTPTLLVQGVHLAQYGGGIPNVHWVVHDPTGDCIVVEYTNGALQLYDNPTRVMTNEPPLPMQLSHLGEYVFLTAAPPAPLKVGNLTLTAGSSGGGMQALPGGFLATNRFVRAFFARDNAPAFTTTAAGVDIARHIINGFDIPPGSVVTPAGTGESGGMSGYETTEWSTIQDTVNKVTYLNTYQGPEWTKIDVAALAAAGPGLRTYPFPAPLPYPEMAS